MTKTLTCITCGSNMVAIGEALLDLTLVVFVYECPNCNCIVRTPVEYEGSFKPKDVIKERVVFT